MITKETHKTAKKIREWSAFTFKVKRKEINYHCCLSMAMEKESQTEEAIKNISTNYKEVLEKKKEIIENTMLRKKIFITFQSCILKETTKAICFSIDVEGEKEETWLPKGWIEWYTATSITLNTFQVTEKELYIEAINYRKYIC